MSRKCKKGIGWLYRRKEKLSVLLSDRKKKGREDKQESKRKKAKKERKKNAF